MILTTIDQSDRIAGLNPRLQVLFDYLKTHDLTNEPLARYEVDGDNIYVNNVHPPLVKAEDQILEAHEVYLDVHIPLDAAEIIGWKPTGSCVEVSKAYDEKKDVILYTDKPENYVTIQPGQILIVYPEDAHAPLIGEGKLRKLVAKVRI